MKKILFFLVLIVFAVCQPSKEKIEEMKKRRKEHDMQIAECILKSPDASPEFKKLIEENKDKDLMRAFHPRDHKLEKNDHDVMRNCRREMLDKRREEHRRQMDRDLERDKEHRRHHERPDL